MATVDFDTKKLTKKIKYNTSAFVRKVVLDGMSQLIKQNPVDTGRSKAGWSTSVQAMESGTTEMQGAKTPLGTKSSLIDYMRSVRAIGSYKLGQTMYLYNNMEYMLPLEYGSSEQAGKGWVRNTAIRMQKKLDEIKDLI